MGCLGRFLAFLPLGAPRLVFLAIPRAGRRSAMARDPR